MSCTVVELEAKIRNTEAQLQAHAAEREKIARQAAATIAECRAALAPLDEEVRRGLSEDSRHAQEVRAQRAALLTRITEAERSVGDWDRANGDTTRRLREWVNEWRAQIPQAQFSALTDPALEQAEQDARSRLLAARDDLAGATDGLAQLRQKLAEAHAATEAEEDAVHRLAELTGERETLQGNAFISGDKADAAKLAELGRRIAESEKLLGQVQQQAAGARAAVLPLGDRINEQQAKVDAAAEAVKAAEDGVLAAVRARAIRQLATLVDGMRTPLLALEAADGTAGYLFCQALTERGLHSIRVDGGIVRPDWLPPVKSRPEGYRLEVAAARAAMLAGETRETPAL